MEKITIQYKVFDEIDHNEELSKPGKKLSTDKNFIKLHINTKKSLEEESAVITENRKEISFLIDSEYFYNLKTKDDSNVITKWEDAPILRNLALDFEKRICLKKTLGRNLYNKKNEIIDYAKRKSNLSNKIERESCFDLINFLSDKSLSEENLIHPKIIYEAILERRQNQFVLETYGLYDEEIYFKAIKEVGFNMEKFWKEYFVNKTGIDLIDLEHKSM